MVGRETERIFRKMLLFTIPSPYVPSHSFTEVTILVLGSQYHVTAKINGYRHAVVAEYNSALVRYGQSARTALQSRMFLLLT